MIQLTNVENVINSLWHEVLKKRKYFKKINYNDNEERRLRKSNIPMTHWKREAESNLLDKFEQYKIWSCGDPWSPTSWKNVNMSKEWTFMATVKCVPIHRLDFPFFIFCIKIAPVLAKTICLSVNLFLNFMLNKMRQ